MTAAQPPQTVGFVLWHVAMMWRRKLRSELKILRITHVQFALLASLQWYESVAKAQPTQREVADHAVLDRMMTSQVIRSLEKRKYITRTEDAHDSRAWRLALTDNGKKVAREAIATVQRVDKEFFGILGEERTGVVEGLRSMAVSMGAAPPVTGKHR